MTIDIPRHKAVPFSAVVSAIEKLEYASMERVMFEMLVLTGCRIRALDNMLRSGLREGILYFKDGKTPRSNRVEPLPDWYVTELEEYWHKYQFYGDRFFNVTSEVYSAYFRLYIRKSIGGVWLEKLAANPSIGTGIRYKCQLKGLRKNFQTLEFARQLAKWKGHADFALQMTSKRMSHSSARITAFHYIENFDELGIQELQDLDLHRLVRPGRQMRLDDF